jgi:hypothetical protein
MPWRLTLSVVAALAASTVIAHATGGESAQSAAAKAFRLPALNRCVQGTSVRISFVPPEGASFASLTVRAGGREVLTVSGITGPGGVRVALPRGTTRVAVAATTSDGLFLEAGRSYRRCTARTPAATPPKPKPRPPVSRAPDRIIPETSGGST